MTKSKRIENFNIPDKSNKELLEEIEDLNKREQESDSIIEKQIIKHQQRKVIKEMKKSIDRKY